TPRRHARGCDTPRARPAAVDAPPVDGHVRGPPAWGQGLAPHGKGGGALTTPPGPLRQSAQAGPGQSDRGPGRVAPPSRGPAEPSPHPWPPLAHPPAAATGTADRPRGRARSANGPPARAGGPPRPRPAMRRAPD